jgi:hypothetical protein
MCTDYTTLGPIGWGGKGKTMSDATRRGKRVAVAAAAIGSAAAPVIFPPTAAAINHPSDTCPGNTFCEWENSPWSKPVQWWGVPAGTLDHDDNYVDNTYSSDHTQGLNDSISSVWNNTDKWVEVFQNKLGGGFSLCLGPGGAVRDLSRIQIQIFPPQTLNDRLSSHYTYSSKPAGCDATSTDQGCSM